MPRGDQLGRQWAIIQIIVNSKYGKTVAELADELECNLRTVYRDLVALQVAGVPIFTERVAGKNLWSIVDLYKHKIPIPFSMPELMALYFSRDLLKTMQSTVFHDNLDSLFRKIKATLPQESDTFLKKIGKVLAVSQKQYKEYGKYRGMIEQVHESALKQRTVKMVYYTMSRKEETSRMVDPYKVWYFNGTFYMVGRCHLRSDIRTFAVDRIKLLNITKKKFTVPDDFSIEDLMDGSFGAIKGKPETVQILFTPKIAGYIEEKVWHKSQQITRQQDGSIILDLQVAINEELINWIMSWGARAEVLAPKSLVRKIEAEAAVLLACYQGGSGRGSDAQRAAASLRPERRRGERRRG